MLAWTGRLREMGRLREDWAIRGRRKGDFGVMVQAYHEQGPDRVVEEDGGCGEEHCCADCAIELEKYLVCNRQIRR